MPEGWDSADSRVLLTSTMLITPTTLALRARELTLQGRTLHNVVAGVLREGTTWRANLDATERNCHLEYRQTGAPEYRTGRLFARRSRAASDTHLTLPTISIV